MVIVLKLKRFPEVVKWYWKMYFLEEVAIKIVWGNYKGTKAEPVV